MSKKEIAICWLRRDLRLDDQAALFHALKSGAPVLAVFIFDKTILDRLENKKDKRVVFIYEQIEKIQKQLIKLGSSMLCYYDQPIDAWKKLLNEFTVKAVYTNHDYEPYAIARDVEIEHLLNQHGIEFNTYKDQVIFEKSEVTKEDGLPYTVYTPYSKKWLQKLDASFLKSYPTEKYFNHFLPLKPFAIPSLAAMGFAKLKVDFPASDIPENIIHNYGAHRNFPGVPGTSHIGLHLRFGTISIRKLAIQALRLSAVFLNELCWREFYMTILWHFPHVVNGAFKKQYDKIQWRNNTNEFERWCNGQTGYPIVDAGMRELNETGYMHNRVRMIVASFLTKHLLIDWRWGEAYFASKLLDFELSSNNGGWQWAAGSGCDAAPYFRIFSPSEQTKKFDPDFKYIRKWVPEFEDFSYPKPIVDHKMARERCLNVYKAALQQNL